MRASGPLPLAAPAPPEAPVSLARLALLFLRIGCTSVGGFMVMVSVTQRLVVERHRLLPAEDVLDGLALASVMPGPVAVNMVAYIGYRLRGVPGAVVCMLCAVLPAFVWITALGTLYFRFGSIDGVHAIFLGVTPAVAAVVLAAGCRLWQAAAAGRCQRLLGGGAAILLSVWPGLPATLLVILAAGLAGWRYLTPPPGACAAIAAAPSAAMRDAGKATPRALPRGVLALAAVLPLGVLGVLGAQGSILFKLMCVFAGMSLVTVGGGYVVIPLLQHTVVDTYGWLSARQFVDGIALTQLSPGPVMISAAFVGLKVAGLAGALAASAGMFIPSAALMLAASGLVERLRRSAPAQAAMCGVRAALAGMVFSAALAIGRMAEPAWPSALLFLLALIALMRNRIDAAWVVAAAAAAGCLFF